MTSTLRTLAGDRPSQIILILSALFALTYLFDDFGLSAPYPADVAIKAAGIVLLAVFAFIHGHRILALGLFLGSLGDIFLALEPSQLPLGIAAFGLGHLVYIFLFARIRLEDGGRSGWSRQPYFGDLQLPASIYNGIILVMTVLAVIGRVPPLATAGALLFLVSDSVLAVRLFTGYLEWAGPVVWVTYYLGQAGIALGLALDGKSAEARVDA